GDRGRPVPARPPAEPVPEGLSIVVRVKVDHTRRHEQPLGVDRGGGSPTYFADLDDRPVLDGDIAAIARESSSVDHHAVLDQQVVRHDVSSALPGVVITVCTAAHNCPTGPCACLLPPDP